MTTNTRQGNPEESQQELDDVGDLEQSTRRLALAARRDARAAAKRALVAAQQSGRAWELAERTAQDIADLRVALHRGGLV